MLLRGNWWNLGWRTIRERRMFTHMYHWSQKKLTYTGGCWTCVGVSDHGPITPQLLWQDDQDGLRFSIISSQARRRRGLFNVRRLMEATCKLFSLGEKWGLRRCWVAFKELNKKHKKRTPGTTVDGDQSFYCWRWFGGTDVTVRWFWQDTEDLVFTIEQPTCWYKEQVV